MLGSKASLVVSNLVKPPGHSRQSSAGRMFESGLSFIKGHSRRSSDQGSGHSKSTTPQPGKNPFEDEPKSTRPVQALTTSRPANSASSNPFEDEETSKNPFEETVKPPKQRLNRFEPSNNPFEEPKKSSQGSNRFESRPPTNPFEQESGGNPFEEDLNPFTEPDNPFLNDDGTKTQSQSSNPFE